MSASHTARGIALKMITMLSKSGYSIACIADEESVVARRPNVLEAVGIMCNELEDCIVYFKRSDEIADKNAKMHWVRWVSGCGCDALTDHGMCATDDGRWNLAMLAVMNATI